MFKSLTVAMFLINTISAGYSTDDRQITDMTDKVETAQVRCSRVLTGEVGMFDAINALLIQSDIPYRVVEHKELSSSSMLVDMLSEELRQRVTLSQGAKAMLTVSPSADSEQSAEVYTLVILPGDESLDFKELSQLLGVSAKKTKLAFPDKVEEMTGCKVGTVPPVALFPNSNIALWVDNSLVNKNQNREIFFTPGRLDRSVFLKVEDYLKFARPNRLVDVIKKVAVNGLR